MSNFIRNPYPFPKPIPPFDPFGIISEIVKRSVRAIKAFFNPDKEIQERKPLDERKSSASDIAELYDVLNKYRAEARTAGAEILTSIKSECTQFFDKTINQFERYSTDFGMTYMSETYRKRFVRMIDGLDDIFDDCMAKKLSLDDSECMSILKMMPGETKAQRMAEFKKSVFMLAIDNVCKRVSECMEDFFDTVDNTFSNKIDSMTDTINEKTSAFEKLTAEGEKNAEKYESVQLEAYKQLTVTIISQTVIEGGAT